MRKLGLLLPTVILVAACTHNPPAQEAPPTNVTPPITENSVEDGRSPAQYHWKKHTKAQKIWDAKESRRCAAVVSWWCDLSENVESYIRDNVSSCDAIDSRSGDTTLALFVLRQTGDVVTAKIRGNAGSACKYRRKDLEGDKIVEVLAVGNKAYMRTERKRLYLMYADGRMKSVPTTRPGDFYDTVTGFRIEDDNKLVLKIGGRETTLLENDVIDRVENCGRRCDTKISDETPALPDSYSLFEDRAFSDFRSFNRY